MTNPSIWPHEYYRDDQMDLSRYLISNPHLASVDDDRKLFFSAYRESDGIAIEIGAIFNFKSSNRIHHNNIGVLHCNGGSLPICERFGSHFIIIIREKYNFVHLFIFILLILNCCVARVLLFEPSMRNIMPTHCLRMICSVPCIPFGMEKWIGQ